MFLLKCFLLKPIFTTTKPILILPRLNEPFQVETDASGYGVGGVLAQERKTDWLPVAYFSQRLSKCERNYSTSEKELYAIVLSVEYFRQFLQCGAKL